MGHSLGEIFPQWKETFTSSPTAWRVDTVPVMLGLPASEEGIDMRRVKISVWRRQNVRWHVGCLITLHEEHGSLKSFSNSDFGFHELHGGICRSGFASQQK